MNPGSTYDFSTAANKAFGSNQVLLSAGVYGFWSGDVNNGTTGGLQDGNVDTSDFNHLEVGLSSFLVDYNYRDLTGDGLVESADYSLMENNVKANVVRSKP
jgi:hypothetical protein